MFLLKKKMFITYSISLIPVVSIILFNTISSTKMKLDASLPGLEKILDGSINVTAIFLGFIVAAISILLGTHDSYLLKAVLEGKKKEELQSDFSFSIIVGLALIVISFVMYPLIEKEIARVVTFENKFFYSWLFVLFSFLIHVLRFNILLIDLLFNLNGESASIQHEDKTIKPEDRDAIRKQVTQSNQNS